MTNKNEQRKVPELRFPEFRGEWKENKLKDLTLLIKDGSHGTHKDVETGPWLLSAKNIKNNKINIDNNDRKISIDDYETIYRNYTLIKNDILLSIVGTIGRTALVENEENIAFQRSVAIIRPNKILTSTFLIQLMNGKRFQKDLKKYQVISAQPGIYLGDLNKLSISFPDKNEQQKIGEFFSKLDRQIELEEKKLALLEEQKKGYMQKIFSQELRFKDENGEEYPEWEEVVIKDVFEMEKGYGMTKELLDKEGINSCVLYGELFTTYNEVIDNIVSKTNYSEGRLIESECIIFPNSTTTKAIDLVTFSSLNNLKCYIGGDITILYPKKLTEINTIYMAYYLTNYQKIKKEISKHAQGITIVHLNFNSFKNIKISIPIIEEQIKIAKLLEKIDLNIKFKKNRINYLKVRKKSLLNRLFI
ncbi:restriction endonuclease subunit S [Macrococcoides caseolyticum]|uniref:restriction endonuclease subunit S n=1 Tax=Macrococcoides caseolyticum TaxID=69966 RepID=UPI0011A97CF3|nr:restriction endonuclease subunit S [Macrococcus caseolyticus]